MTAASPAADPSSSAEPLGAGEILRLWWPLGASWMLMGLELPLFSAAVARLPNAEVNLAAHGGVVFPIALAIEAPIMMLLVASTALARDRASFALIRRFMMAAGFALTLLHALIAFTPLFDVLATRVLGAPPQIIEPARLGLRVMLPWTWSIAYRRLYQGLLIRHGRSRPVAAGTVVRLLANVAALLLGVLHGGLPGIVVGAIGISAGVIAEAVFIGICAHPIERGALRDAAPLSTPLGLGAFLRFYVPLALTQLLSLATPPLCAAAVSRMPMALASLAAWPAATGLSFFLRGPSFGFHEVVVSLLDRPGGKAALRRFARGIAVTTFAAGIIVGATPLGDAWFLGVIGLPEHVARLARSAIMVACLLPPITALEFWWQGRLVHAHRTRSVTAATAIYLACTAALLGVAVAVSPLAGIHSAMIALTLAAVAKTAWLASRARVP